MTGLPPRILCHVGGEIQTNCYILVSPDGLMAIVVDPGAAGDLIANELAARNMALRSVVLTHGHIDHLQGLSGLLDAAGPAPVLLHSDDRMLWDAMDIQAGFLGVPRPTLPDMVREMHHGDVVVEAGWTVDVVHTPGHSPGSVLLSLRGHDTILSGDTVFHHGIGRTDLWGGSWEQLVRSIEQRILTLPHETIVLPGHGEPTTVGEIHRWSLEVGLAGTSTEPW